jgi:hypothetical protein
LISGLNVAFCRSTSADSAIWSEMIASCAWVVPGIDALTFSFGLSSGINWKSEGRLFALTYCHGPVSPGAENQRPVTRT